ncbi:AAA ATPase [Podila epicladia]|nr:AAA ATPase [Podila epicladia]KAG0088678.1 AAA ATPase [Podila epicladia]
MATFLRKRPMTMVFSDTEDDVVGKAWPATPTKRRSGFNQALAQIIPPPNFAACLAENSECDENTEPSNEEKLGEMLTPPMTPTRRKSTRQSTAAAAAKLPALSPSSTSDDTENSPPSTPARRRGKSLGTPANTNNNTTGLTPALNRMFKNENILAPKKLLGQDEAKTNYLTPKRLGRTKSNIELTELPSAKKEVTLESSLVSSSSTLTTPSTSTPTTALGYYQEAKTLFRRTTEPQRLVGRAVERGTIRQFCDNHMLTAKAGSLYISGQPGTGKTALLKEVMRDMDHELKAAQHDVKVVLINCMTIKDPKMVYQKILEELGLETSTKDKDGAVKAVESLVLGKNKGKKAMYVTILDEIDQLLTKDQEVLYKLFHWSSLESSRLTLIGIANALDMTDRFLPRLKAKNCEPQLLNFNPYQVAEIKAIIMDRLFSLEGTPEEMSKDKNEKQSPRMAPLMQRPAIELCARKVAAATGDLRKALDICRQTIEMVEMETKKKERAERLPSQPMPLQEISLADLENRAAGTGQAIHRIPLSRSMSSSAIPVARPNESSEVTLQEVPKVTVEHVKKALASAFGSPTIQKMKALNVHQKIVLAVMVIKIQNDKTIDCEVGKIFDHYSSVCRNTGKIGAVNRSEYQDLINMLEANGLVTLGKAKEERLRKVGLVPRESEVLEAVKGQDILDAILATGAK